MAQAVLELVPIQCRDNKQVQSCVIRKNGFNFVNLGLCAGSIATLSSDSTCGKLNHSE